MHAQLWQHATVIFSGVLRSAQAIFIEYKSLVFSFNLCLNICQSQNLFRQRPNMSNSQTSALEYEVFFMQGEELIQPANADILFPAVVNLHSQARAHPSLPKIPDTQVTKLHLSKTCTNTTFLARTYKWSPLRSRHLNVTLKGLCHAILASFKKTKKCLGIN